MTTDLLALIKQGLPANFSELASKAVGESPGATQTALSAALPALVGAIAQKGATDDGAQSLLTLLDDPAVSTGALSNLSAVPGGEEGSASLSSAGSGLLGSLLGDKAGALAGTLASVAGLRNSQSASRLLALLAPIVLGFIRKLVGEQRLGASALASLLAGQGPFLQGTLDRRLTSALGFATPSSLLDSLGGKATAAIGAAEAAMESAGAAIGSAGATAASTAQSAGVAAASTAQRTGAAAADVAADAARGASGWTRWLPWLIGAIIVIFLLTRLSTCSETAEKSTTAPPTNAPAATAPAAPPPATAPAASPPAPTAPAAPVVGSGSDRDPVVIREHGDLDLGAAAQLRQTLQAAFTEGDDDVLVDLTAVEFVDSVILSVFITAHKRFAAADRHLSFLVPPMLLRVFELTGLIGVLDVRAA